MITLKELEEELLDTEIENDRIHDLLLDNIKSQKSKLNYARMMMLKQDKIFINQDEYFEEIYSFIDLLKSYNDLTTAKETINLDMEVLKKQIK